MAHVVCKYQVVLRNASVETHRKAACACRSNDTLVLLLVAMAPYQAQLNRFGVEGKQVERGDKALHTFGAAQLSNVQDAQRVCRAQCRPRRKLTAVVTGADNVHSIVGHSEELLDFSLLRLMQRHDAIERANSLHDARLFQVVVPQLAKVGGVAYAPDFARALQRGHIALSPSR